MNRSLLLIICDFLLLSLLALARFDEPEAQQQTATVDELQRDTLADQDLIEVLRLSLEAERDDRADLTEDLEQTRAELEAREQALRDREQRLAREQERAANLERQRQRLADEKAALAAETARLDQERAQFAEQFQQTQERLSRTEADRAELAKSLGDIKEDSAAARERVRLLQEQLAAKEQALSDASAEQERLAESMQAAEQQARQLSTRLEVAEAETRVLSQSLETARADIAVTRQEKAAVLETTDKLAEGVSTLAASTDQIREEVQRANPLSLNTIYDRYLSNRVSVTFIAEESALIGTSTQTYTVETCIVSSGGRTAAVFHAEDTPFDLSGSGRGLREVSATLELAGRTYRLPFVSTLQADPRLLAVYFDAAAIAGTVEAFDLAQEPLRFPEAVLIDNRDRGYGEIPFKLDPADLSYYEMQTDLFDNLFGDFAPGSGDAVFSKTGSWIGLMVTSDTAVSLENLSPARRLPLGDDFNPDAARSLVTAQARTLSSLPSSVR